MKISVAVFIKIRYVTCFITHIYDLLHSHDNSAADILTLYTKTVLLKYLKI